MTHVRTSPYYPQSQRQAGTLARHRSRASASARRRRSSADEARARAWPRYVEHYNDVRLHSAIGYVTPTDKLAGRERAIWDAARSPSSPPREKGGPPHAKRHERLPDTQRAYDEQDLGGG